MYKVKIELEYQEENHPLEDDIFEALPIWWTNMVEGLINNHANIKSIKVNDVEVEEY